MASASSSRLAKWLLALAILGGLQTVQAMGPDESLCNTLCFLSTGLLQAAATASQLTRVRQQAPREQPPLGMVWCQNCGCLADAAVVNRAGTEQLDHPELRCSACGTAGYPAQQQHQHWLEPQPRADGHRQG